MAKALLAPPIVCDEHETKSRLVRAGLALFTERGFDGVGVGEILARTGLPKGCFYHHFTDKEAYVLAVIAAYARYFNRKLEQWFGDSRLSPEQRLRRFVDDALSGMGRHGFRRGCLVGILGQERGGHTLQIQEALNATWQTWERRLCALLEEAIRRGEIPAASRAGELASVFWTGWEGAVLRMKLTRNREAGERFLTHYLALVFRPKPTFSS